MLLRVYQRQVLLQAQFILWGANDVNEVLKSQSGTSRVFYGLQNILNAAANISKALWGSGGNKEEERKTLRDSLGISDTSPLRATFMRNNFEHHDERIDDWWKNSARRNHADLVVGPPRAIVGLDDGDRFRFFDPNTTEMIFWGQSFNLQEMVNEIQRILPILQRELT